MRISLRNRPAASGQSLLMDINRVLSSTSDLNVALTSALALISDSRIAGNLDLALDLDLDRAFAPGLASKLDCGIALDLASNFDRALHRVRDFDRALDSVRTAYTLDTTDLVRVRDFDRALDRVLNLCRDLDSDLNVAWASALAHTGEGERATERQPRVVPLAGRLLAAAAHLLPANDRARYAEEFRSELAEIARVKARRRPQLAYAARQVASAWRLRADLRAPRARKAAP